jgi:hypothetical protein
MTKKIDKKQQTKTQFDKFIEDQLSRENVNKVRQQKIIQHGETPQQKYNKLYREKPQNRTVWSPK